MPSNLDLELSPSAFARDWEQTLQAYADRSRAAARRHRPEVIPHGPDPREVTWFFAAERSRRTFVYLHGGHWQESGPDVSCFLADQALASGMNFAAVGYPLAPRASMPEILDSVTRGCRQVAEHTTGRSGGAEAQIVLCGSSAGAHLAATLAPSIEHTVGLVLLSGVYDLGPVIDSYVNVQSWLSAQDAQEFSPLRSSQVRTCPTVLACGEHESPFYLLQQKSYAAHLRERGVGVVEVVETGRDHFDVVFDVLTRGTAVGDAVTVMLDEEPIGGPR